VAAGEAASGVEFTSGPERSADAWRAQQADALVAIAKAYLGHGLGAGAVASDSSSGSEAVHARTASIARSTSSADHYQVVVHVDEKSLRGGMGRADLPIETIKRLTCDGSLITIVEDAKGTPLDVGRKQRTVSTPLKRALWSRDRGCSFPGCEKTRYVDAHHIHHWANGGDTSLDNLALLRTHHHTLLHEGGFTIHRDERGGIYFRRPDGRVIPGSGYRAADMLDDVALRCRAKIPPRRGGWLASCRVRDRRKSLRGGIRGSARAGESLRGGARGARRIPSSTVTTRRLGERGARHAARLRLSLGRNASSRVRRR
jgi:hypothetical protein